jgi:hypothetical protein
VSSVGDGLRLDKLQLLLLTSIMAEVKTWKRHGSCLGDCPLREASPHRHLDVVQTVLGGQGGGK